MMTPAPQPSLKSILTHLVDDIDVPEGKYADAQDRYNAVGAWLGAEGSALAPYGVRIYPQGSFSLGTVIKPADGDEYDVDAVCLLERCPARWSQEQLRKAVGDRLRESGVYGPMLKPPQGKRRCWRLQYADGSSFHLDIVPARPDDWRWLTSAGVPERFARHALQITCMDAFRELQWPRSNPRGYQEWFVERMQVVFEEERKRIALSKRADVAQVPTFGVRTPLQRVVQILKRQRDVMFGNDADKPISVIVTTLAALAYRSERDIEAAYIGVASRLRAVASTGGHFTIPNPVNPQENFADRWAKRPARADRFAEWLEDVESTAAQLAAASGLDKQAEVLTESFGATGTRAYRAALSASGSGEPSLIKEAVALSSNVPAVRNAPHRQAPPWPLALEYEASISARGPRRNGFRTPKFSDRSPSAPLEKHLDIWFTLSTDAPPPFEVHWQVVNSGPEAAALSQLRGGFYPGGVRHKETTQYRGSHTVQAFVVKNGRCVAKSRRAVVNIR